jgi:hypothetical protein
MEPMSSFRETTDRYWRDSKKGRVNIIVSRLNYFSPAQSSILIRPRSAKPAPAIGGEDRAFAVFEVGEDRIGGIGKILFG